MDGFLFGYYIIKCIGFGLYWKDICFIVFFLKLFNSDFVLFKFVCRRLKLEYEVGKYFEGRIDLVVRVKFLRIF